MWPEERRAIRFGDLLEIFETHHHQMRWDPSVRPYLQYKFATELFSCNETQKKAVGLWEKALDDQHCLEFLRARIIYSQANSHRSGQGHSKQRIAAAYSYYNWVVGQSYAETPLKQQAKLDMANMLRIGHAELRRDQGKAKELYCELLETLKADDPLHAEVYYGLAACYQDGLDGATKNVVKALHYYMLLFQTGCPKKLLERAIKRKEACELALKAEIEQLQNDKVVTQQSLLDLERENRDAQSEKISLERKIARADEAEEENTRLIKDLEKERQQSQEHIDQIAKNASELTLLKAHAQLLTEQRDGLSRERAELDNEKMRLKAALAQAQEVEAEKNKLAEEKARFEKELENERLRTQGHIDQIGKDASEIEQLKAQLQTLTEQRDTLLTTSLQAEESEKMGLKAALTRVDELDAERKKLVEEKALLEAQKENETLKDMDQIGGYVTEIEELEAQVQALNEQRTASNWAYAELNTNLQTEQSEKARLKAVLEEAQQNFNTSQQKLAIALEHIKKSRETAIDPREHERIKKQLSDQQVANRQLKDEIADYEWQLEEAQKDTQPIRDLQKSSINSLKAELAALKQMVTTLKEQTISELFAIGQAAKDEHENSVKELDLLKGYIVLLQNRAKESEEALMTSELQNQNNALVSENSAMKERLQRLIALQNSLEQMRSEEKQAYTAVNDTLLSEKATLENENSMLKASLARALSCAGLVERDESTQ